MVETGTEGRGRLLAGAQTHGTSGVSAFVAVNEI